MVRTEVFLGMSVSRGNPVDPDGFDPGALAEEVLHVATDWRMLWSMIVVGVDPASWQVSMVGARGQPRRAGRH
jgi:hypothetical protein